MRALARAALAGAATGSRSGTGLAALALATPAAGTALPDRVLRRGGVQAVITAAALVELGADQLPGAPSRLAPAGLGARIVAAAAAGTIVALRDETPRPGGGPAPAAVAAAVTVAAGTAVAAAWLGARWRAAAARRFGRDTPGAVIEDAVALALAWAAAGH